MQKLLLCLLLAVCSQLAGAEAVPVDTSRSSLTIHVEKSGLFSAFAHNHTIQAPIASGQFDIDKRSITLAFNTKEIKVLDEGVKDSERAEIDQTMKSDKVLDVQRFPEIRFVSTSVIPQPGDHFHVSGDLTIH